MNEMNLSVTVRDRASPIFLSRAELELSMSSSNNPEIVTDHWTRTIILKTCSLARAYWPKA